MADPTEPNEPAPKPVADPPAPSSKAWTKLNKEAAEALDRANIAEQKLAAAEAERARHADSATAAAVKEAAAEAARTAAEAESATLRGKVKQTATAASLKVAAIQAGIIDLDALRLVDMGALETDDAGELKDGKAVMEKLKAEKPYLFGAAGTQTPPASTSNPTNPPAPKAPSKRPALDMTPAEFKAAVKAGAWRS